MRCRQTTGASWKAIVEALDNPVQQKIVADDREQTNVLVLAGPGSGKTRVLVHRIAYLIRVRREDPRDILVLTFRPISIARETTLPTAKWHPRWASQCCHVNAVICVPI